MPALGWSTIPTDVATVSPTDAWTVGGYLSGQSRLRGFTMRWTGLHWQIVPFSTGTRQAVLNGIAVTGDGIWAVGDLRRTSGASSPLTTHWDGTSWHRIPLNISSSDASLEDVAGIPRTNSLWAVGSRVRAGGRTRALIVRWGGAGWHPVASPRFRHGAVTLSGVAALGPKAAFAVGSRFVKRLQAYRSVLEHWNGSKWHVMRTPHPGTSDQLSAIAWDSDGTAWAVGVAMKGNTRRALILRLDGATWRIARWFHTESSLEDVLVASPTDAWAVGGWTAHGTSPGYDVPFTARRHGAPWAFTKAPSAVGASTLVGVSGTPHNVWAVAQHGGDTGASFSFHWC